MRVDIRKVVLGGGYIDHSERKIPSPERFSDRWTRRPAACMVSWAAGGGRLSLFWTKEDDREGEKKTKVGLRMARLERTGVTVGGCECGIDMVWCVVKPFKDRTREVDDGVQE